MRINKYVAQATGMSRRAADTAIAEGRVEVNNKPVHPGQYISGIDVVMLDGQPITAEDRLVTIALNKPAGYVVSRNGQGSKTIYDILPTKFHNLKPVGRLDKDSSGLILLTNDGQLANRLTHPKYQKQKIYEVRLDKELSDQDFKAITKQGINLDDGISKFELDSINDENYEWRVTMSEGRNRQIRRTFAALGYSVTRLHRTQFGEYQLVGIKVGEFKLM